MKTAVVFGGSGLVGKSLLDELIGNDEYGKVIAVLRTIMPCSDPKLEQIFFPDFSQLKYLKDELKATDFYCCIGTTIKEAGSHKAFHEVDFDIPIQIARLAEEISIPNFVLVSSMCADSESSNFYLRTKGRMEEAVQKIYSGNLKIIRPSFLIGKRSDPRFLESVAKASMIVFGWLFVGPLEKYRAVFAHDVAKALVKSTAYPADKVIFESNELRTILSCEYLSEVS